MDFSLKVVNTQIVRISTGQKTRHGDKGMFNNFIVILNLFFITKSNEK